MSSSRAPRKRPAAEVPSPAPKKAKTRVKESREAKELGVKEEKTSRSKGEGKKKEKGATLPAVPRKPTLFDDLDASPKTATKSSDLQYLQSLDKSDDGDSNSDTDSALSSMSDIDFEDVPLAQGKANEKANEKAKTEDGEDESSDSDDDMEFEDVAAPGPAPFSFLSMAMDDDAAPSGDLELTLVDDTRVNLTALYGSNAKKGPTKIERLVRSTTHCVHVQSLLWHNAVRNAWLCDAEVQGLLMSQLPPRMWDEVERWQRASGLHKEVETAGVAGSAAGTLPSGNGKGKGKGKGKVKGNEKSKSTRSTTKDAKDEKDAEKASQRTSGTRDWSAAAARLEQGSVDMSHGDPLFRLLRSLAAWWRQTFRVTAPGLRKTGFLTLERLDRFLKAAKDTGGSDPERFGERIRNRAAFREHAACLEGSRDVGAQLFTALLRALGLEARMVASLQPLGFGWNKLEDADAEEEDEEGEEEESTAASKPVTPRSKSATPKAKAKEKAKPQPKKKEPAQPTARPSRSTAAPVVIIDSDDDPDLQDLELAEVNSDNDSVVFFPEEKVDKTPTKMKASSTQKAYDKDLAYPIYWTEVLSPATQKYVPVDALVKHVVATNRELVESFEPRGAKADKARQVMAYVVGYSADGTAKDVTVRYLRKQVLPGRTRGVRFPVEKVPVYNRHGKVRRYDMVDWFRQSVMQRGYARGESDRYPLTEVDEAEDSTDLRPAEAEKKPVKVGEETLQYYKQSKEFVLERHLKREEALRAGARPVNVFRNSKGRRKKGENNDNEDDDADAENVYLRADVVNVKSAETWHKQGRAPAAGERPLKQVPYRAATTNRRREIAEAEAASGEKVLQGLYSYEQTEWIVPDPIRDGIIPKNAYGNIDLFAEHMCPQGAVHVPFRGAMRVCKKLGVDFAEAVVDFEFGNRMAVPVIQGVVIAEEHHDRVMEQLARDEEERARKEDEKRCKTTLGQWRKMLMGLRIVERIRQDYGDIAPDECVFGHTQRDVIDLDGVDGDGVEGDDRAENNTGSGGGFLPEGYEYEDEGSQRLTTSSFFPVHDDADEDGDTGGGFVVE